MFEIKVNSTLPKYKQLMNSITSNIELGKIKMGEQLPSINQVSINYYLSRDTVEKAYKMLREKGVVESVKRKGYFVLNSSPESKIRILVLFNKLSSYKKVIYNNIVQYLNGRANIDFFIYHCDPEMFETIIREQYGKYNYYVIMPHFTHFNRASIIKSVSGINPEKLIILDNLIEGVDRFHGAVYQDFKMDIYTAMLDGLKYFKRYKKLILIFPKNVAYPYPKDIEIGFRRFCSFNHFEFDVISQIQDDTKLEKGEAYVVIEENDLARLIKNIKLQDLKIRENIGILSYNDTPLKEVLADGISVITTDFEKMGELTAKMVLNEVSGSFKNDFKLILRESL